jgi:hypothetical protein
VVDEIEGILCVQTLCQAARHSIPHVVVDLLPDAAPIFPLSPMARGFEGQTRIDNLQPRNRTYCHLLLDDGLEPAVHKGRHVVMLREAMSELPPLTWL